LHRKEKLMIRFARVASACLSATVFIGCGLAYVLA
jgi:hypothetical protein